MKLTIILPTSAASEKNKTIKERKPNGKQRNEKPQSTAKIISKLKFV